MSGKIYECQYCHKFSSLNQIDLGKHVLLTHLSTINACPLCRLDYVYLFRHLQVEHIHHCLVCLKTTLHHTSCNNVLYLSSKGIKHG